MLSSATGLEKRTPTMIGRVPVVAHQAGGIHGLNTVFGIVSGEAASQLQAGHEGRGKVK